MKTKTKNTSDTNEYKLVIETVEQALAVIGNRIASPEFASLVRNLLSDSDKLKYELTIKKSNQPGFLVALDYSPEVKKKSLGVLLRLT